MKLRLFLFLMMVGLPAFGAVTQRPSTMSTDKTWVWNWSGSTFGPYGASSIPGITNTYGLTVTALGLPTVTGSVVGTAGSTSRTYKVSSVAGGYETLPCNAVTITTGPATLGSLNYCRLSWPVVTGATAYRVYRLVGASYDRLAELYTNVCNDTGALTPNASIHPQTVDQTGKITGAITGIATTAVELADGIGTLAYDNGGDAWVFGGDTGVEVQANAFNAQAGTGFFGNLTGNVTGNVSGSSGSCTGNAATVTNGVYTTASNTLTGTTNLIKPGTNNTTAFQVQPSASTTPVLNVDTTNSRVGIGIAAPKTALDVLGTLSLGGTGTISLIPDIQIGATSARTLRFNNSTSITDEGFEFYNSKASTSLMAIRQDGNVGIGTVAPSAKLHISSANFPVQRIERVTSSSGNIYASDYAVRTRASGLDNGAGVARYFGLSDNTGTLQYAGCFGVKWLSSSAKTMQMIFCTANSGDDPIAGTERMLINGTGEVGIGVSPTSKLHVAGTAPASVAGNGTAATTALTVTGAAGGASSGTTGQTGGAGASIQLTGGAGGAVAGTGGIGGAGGDITLTPGAGGAGASTNGRTGKVIISIANVPDYANNAAAVAGGLTNGMLYRNGDILMIVHS